MPNETEPEGESVETVGVRRSTRAGNVPTILGTFIQHVHTVENADNTEEYNENTAQVIAHIMCHYSITNWRRMSKKKLYQLVQTYTLQKEIKRFGEKRKQATYKEMKQLHDRVVFESIQVETLTSQERKRAMESLIF